MADEASASKSRIMVRFSASADIPGIEQKYRLKFLKLIRGSHLRVYFIPGKDPLPILLENIRREPGVELAEEDARLEAF